MSVTRRHHRYKTCFIASLAMTTAEARLTWELTLYETG